MSTQDEIKRLDLNWSLVIKAIHPTIDTIVKGDPESIESLLSVWNTGNAAYAQPTEAELLDALATVEAEITAQVDIDAIQNSARDAYASLPNWATWTASEAETWINANVDNLASAKIVLVNLAKAVIYLRNQTMPDLQGR